jgi:hypothetical protein
MTQVIQYTPRRSLGASAKLSDEEIKERHLKHIAEITNNLAPPQSEDLNYEQQQWLRRRMRSPMPKPYKPFTPVEIPYKWIDRNRSSKAT